MKKILIILLVVIVLLMIISAVKIELYTSNYSNNIQTNWNNSKGIVWLSGKVGKMEDLPQDSFPVVVKYDTLVVGDIHEPHPIVVDLNDVDFGPIWMPFYKASDYSISVNLKKEYEVNTDKANIKYRIDGQISISGKYKIVGLCSTQKAKELVIRDAMEKIYSDAKINGIKL
ncbi:MAG TPA: hypothetical protein PK252_08115 [Bacteroidales bacterium]|nr:hypothetical protein [Bacteroidales bacterium]